MRATQPRAVIGMPEGQEFDALSRVFEHVGIEAYRPQEMAWLQEMSHRSDTVAAILDARDKPPETVSSLIQSIAGTTEVPIGVIAADGAAEGLVEAGASAVAASPLGLAASWKLLLDLAYPGQTIEERAEERRKDADRLRLQTVKGGPAPRQAGVTPREALRDRLGRRPGKFKIYLGAAPGVGKTYAMLREAHDRMGREEDVFVGIVETHGRKETESQVGGLRIIPRRMVDYKGAALGEMDVDAILSRHPALVLVDELAHTNVPGSLNRKRFEDVEILRTAGIGVLSTLNIQHLESLNNLIERITGVKVRETIPDGVLLEADEVVLVDLPAEDLQERLQAGKIYAPEKVSQALSNFFTTHNLTALRELALRELADRVDMRLEEVRESLGRGEEPTGIQERILACIPASESAARLIRRAARLASRLNAELTVLHVASEKISPRERRALTDSQELAESLDAKIATVTGDSVGEAIATFANESQTTLVVLGESRRSRWRALVESPLLDAILSRTTNIDIVIVARHEEAD